MKEIESELLMRYADGDLSALECQRLQLLMDQDPTAKERVARFRTQRTMIDAAFKTPPPPDLDRLTRHVDEAFATRHRAAKANLGFGAWKMPLAASIAVGVLALGGGYYAGISQFQSTVDSLLESRHQDQMMAASILSEALETHESGRTFVWAGEQSDIEVEITPLRTFRSASGKWCREYQQRTIGLANVEQRQGVACRDAEGSWQRTFERPDNA